MLHSESDSNFPFIPLHKFNCTGKSIEEAEYSAALVESSGEGLPANPIDNDASDPVNGIVKKRRNYDKEDEAKITSRTSWDKQAKNFDRCALVLMPLLFLLVSTTYCTSYLWSG